MAKQYAVLSADGKRTSGFVTAARAREMVRNGEANWCSDKRAIQLPRAFASIPRGLSASPTSKLTERYVEALNSGHDKDALSAIDGWATIKARLDVKGWSSKQAANG